VLDVRRVVTREPKAIEPRLDEVRAASSAEPRLTHAVTDIEEMIKTPETTGAPAGEQNRRGHAGDLARGICTPAVADAFCTSRLDGDWAPTFGTLSPGTDVASIIEFPRLR
jgi:putative acyl-CoA dehydrogenase